MARFTQDPLDPVEVARYIKMTGAPTTKEIKLHFASTSEQVRRVCGRLMAANKVMPITAKGTAGIYYMLVSGVKGRPSPMRARAEAQGIAWKGSAQATRKAARNVEAAVAATAQPRGVELDDDGYPMHSTMEA